MSLSADIKPIIFGCTGPTLEVNEAAFFRHTRPAGFILFQKNCVDPAQVQTLCRDLRAAVGWDAPILIDQEGGRVQRLKAPRWPDFPALRGFGDMYAVDPAAALAAAADHHAALAGAQCPIGIDVNCVPVLDVVPQSNTQTRAIDDRAFSHDADIVAELGLASVRAAIDSGMTPVMKHMPGHGRATVDSHHDLPRVDAGYATLEADWQPFKRIAWHVDSAHVWGMTAHVIYDALDAELPATLSPAIIADTIRGMIGFDGLLVTDDLFMDALKPWGDVPQRCKLAIEAGADLALHCHGDIAAREAAIAALPPMSFETHRRLKAWISARDKAMAGH